MIYFIIIDNLNNANMNLVAIPGKERGLSETKINELQTNSKNRNIRDSYRGINEFNKGYQPRTNILKDEEGNLVADSHTILSRSGNACYYLMQNLSSSSFDI